ncbi:MAG: hypothetical protein ACTSPW_06125 [Promethearchaeota archaeon]
MLGNKIKKYKYIGPKAIFDPNFIPPKLLFRKEEEQTLFSILKDSMIDNFSINVLYQGIEGIGKKVIIRKVLHDINLKKTDFSDLLSIYVDCNDKDQYEIIFSILSTICNKLNLILDLNAVLNSNSAQLWSLFKLVIKKSNYQTFLVLNNIDSIQNFFFKKILNFGKENNISILTTINKFIRNSNLELLREFDIKEKLRYYNYNELFKILDQRVQLTFLHEIDRDLLYYIVDLIFENYVPIPGKGMEILRTLYPILKEKNNIENRCIMEICHNQFDSITLDEYSLLTYLADNSILELVFMDNLTNHFNSNIKFYTTLEELKELYEISCECLEYKKSEEEFKEILRNTVNIGILAGSNRNNNLYNHKTKRNILNYDSFFILVNPEKLKTILDTIFNQNQFLS